MMLVFLAFLAVLFGGTYSSFMTSHGNYARPLSRISPLDMRRPGMNGKGHVGHNILVAPKYKWPQGVVYWQYDPANNFTSEEKAILEGAMAKIAEVACVYFKPKTTQTAYLSFKNSEEGCWSSLGFWNTSQEMNMAPYCFDDYSVALHGLLHVLGMEHEHARYDRDLYLEVLWENVEKGMEDEFRKLPRTYAMPRFDFDVTSLLMFSPYSFGVEGMPTMSLMMEGVDEYDVGRSTSMSKSDEWRLMAAYKCHPPSETLPAPADPAEVQRLKTLNNYF